MCCIAMHIIGVEHHWSRNRFLRQMLVDRMCQQSFHKAQDHRDQLPRDRRILCLQMLFRIA